LQWVYRYDSAGTLLDRFGGPTAYLFHPRGMTIFEDDTVALADTGGSRLALFSSDGLPAGSIGGLGNGPGQFNEPTDVLRDAQGTYFVAEAENNRIQRVDAGGSPLSQWAIPDSYGFNGPHLAFGPDGSIFVTESQSRSLLRYAPDGELLDQWQTIGPVNLAAPVGVYFDAKTNRLYVTDVLTHQVYVFEVQINSD
jgi:DNA-binding beta-propeller fold protein YncE